MRLDTLAGGLAALAAGWFAVCALLWGVANTLDSCALALHRTAGSWRALQTRRTRELAEAWVRTIERAETAPDARDEAFLRRSGIRQDGYTGD